MAIGVIMSSLDNAGSSDRLHVIGHHGQGWQQWQVTCHDAVKAVLAARTSYRLQFTLGAAGAGDNSYRLQCSLCHRSGKLQGSAAVWLIDQLK